MSVNLSLTIFLIKEEYTVFEDILEEDSYTEQLYLKEYLNNIDGAAFTGENKENEPKWNAFLKEALENYTSQKTKSTRVVLFIRRKGRILAFTFGFGRHLIKDDAYVRNFGLRVILNNTKRDKLKSIDSSTIDEKPFHNRIQASRAARFEEFNITDLRTFFRGIVANSSNKERYGATLKGKDNLQINYNLKLNNINNLCDKLLDDYKRNNYKDIFPEIDRIEIVNDPGIIDNLNQRLIRNFIKKEHVYLIIPDIIDWMSTDGFKYTPKGDLYSAPSLVDFWDAKSLNAETLTLKSLKSHYLKQISNDEIIRKWSIKNCISGEIFFQGKHYVYSIGEWFEIDHNLVKFVNNYIKRVPQCDINFPTINGLHEEHANILFEREIPSLLNADRKVMRIDNSSYEVCDLLSNDHKLIHVKWWDSSATLSHLFSQGKVSGEILLHDKNQRKKINNYMKDYSPSFKEIIKTDGYSSNDYTIVFAIIYRGVKPIEERLPFFSKVNLKQAVNELQSMGYNVELAHIRSTCKRLSKEQNNKLIKKMDLVKNT